MSKLLLFDIDGTLIGPCMPHGRSMLTALKTICDVDADIRVLNPAGMTDSQIIIELLRHCGFKQETIRAVLPDCLRLSAEYFTSTVTSRDVKLLEGVRDLIGALRQTDHVPGLVTGNIRGIAKSKLDLAGIGDAFGPGGFGCQHHVRAELVKIALANVPDGMSFRPDQVLVIGDTVRDIEAARASGVKVLAVASGNTPFEELKACEPDFITASFADLDETLAIINS